MQRNITVNKEISSVINDSLSSTARSLAYLEDTKKLGRETLVELEHQGEQIINAQRSEDAILVEQKQASRYVASIHGIFAAIFNRFRSDPHATDNVKKGDKLIAKHQKKPGKVKQKKSTPTPNNGHLEDFVDLSMLSADDKNKLRQTNQNIERMAKGVSELKEIAVEMGNEVDRHNMRLDLLSKTTEEATSGLNRLQSRM